MRYLHRKKFAWNRLPIIFSSYSHVIYCWTLSFYHVWPLKSVRSSIEPSASVFFSLHVFSWFYKEDSALCSFRNERLFWFQNIQMWTCILAFMESRTCVNELWWRENVNADILFERHRSNLAIFDGTNRLYHSSIEPLFTFAYFRRIFSMHI